MYNSINKTSVAASTTLKHSSLKRNGLGRCVYLLLEVSPLLLVYQHQVKVVSHRELLVDVSHSRGQFIPAQKQTDRDRLTWCRIKGKGNG